MNDIQLNHLTFNLYHISYQSLCFIIIYTIYYHLHILNINYIWLALLFSYCDWLIWRNIQSAIFLLLVIFGILLLFRKNEQIHHSIQTNITEKWSNMILAY